MSLVYGSSVEDEGSSQFYDPLAIPLFTGGDGKFDDLAEELKNESDPVQQEQPDVSVWDLKINPPEVTITDVDDFLQGQCTEISATSANRAGTLLQMIQVISEADLTIERAHVSTDGRWFHDSILVQDPLTKGYIKDRQKRRAVESMLHVSTGPQRTDTMNSLVDLKSLHGSYSAAAPQCVWAAKAGEVVASPSSAALMAAYQAREDT